MQHNDSNTNVSVDFGGIRVLPSIKTPDLLAKDLQESLLGYFSLKNTTANADLSGNDLLPVGEGAIGYMLGPYGPAANFSGGTTYLQFPKLRETFVPSFTLSIWTLVNTYPAAGEVTGLAGALLLDSSGMLNFQFRYNNTVSHQTQTFQSRSSLGLGTWHSVVVTYR